MIIQPEKETLGGTKRQKSDTTNIKEEENIDQQISQDKHK